MIKNTIKLTIAFLLLFFLSTQVLAVIFIDVENFKVVGSVHAGIKVCIFDTTKQQYIYIGYYEKARVTVVTELLPGLPYGDQLVIDYGGNIRIRDGFEPTNSLIRDNPRDPYGYIIRTRVTTDGEGTGEKIPSKITIGDVVCPVNTYVSKAIQPFSGDVIKVLLAQLEGKKHRDGEVVIKFFSRNEPNKGDVLELSTIQDVLGASKSDNSLLRDLGELATECTMIGYGYEWLPSQRNHQGLDGVFKHEEIELFITESKCGEYQDSSARKVAEEFLNLQCIQKRKEEIPSEYSATRMIVERFLDNHHPGKIFTFAHRVKKDGQCECHVELFKESTSSTSSSSPSSVSAMDMVQGCEICFTGQASLDDFLSGIFTQLSLEDSERAERCLQCLLAKKKQAAVKHEFYSDGDLYKILMGILLRAAKMVEQGKKDTTTIPGWTLYDPAPDGNCFFNAVYNQLQEMNHELIGWITQEGDSYNVLRANIQGLGFIPGTWADEGDIINLIRGFDVDVAVYYTDPATQWYGGYTYYYVEQGIINRIRVEVGKLPRNRRIIRLAYTGTHYMSIISPDDPAMLGLAVSLSGVKIESSSVVAAAAAPMPLITLPASFSSSKSFLILPLPVLSHSTTNQSQEKAKQLRLHADLSYEIPQLPNTTQPISQIRDDVLEAIMMKAKGGELRCVYKTKCYNRKDRRECIEEYLKQVKEEIIVISDNFKNAYPEEIRQVNSYIKIIDEAVTQVLSIINSKTQRNLNKEVLDQIDSKIQQDIIKVAVKIQKISQAIRERKRSW